MAADAFTASPHRGALPPHALLFAGPFLLLAAVPILYYGVAPEACAGAIAMLLAALLISERASSRPVVAATKSRGCRLVAILYIPAQIAVTAWAILLAGRATLSPLVFWELVLSVGLLMGVFGMLVAHEMVHSVDRRERALGAVMLTAMMYRHFRIAHVYGHHRFAATTRDAATARLGEGFYGYLARTLFQQWHEAWAFEQRRCARLRFASFHNRIYQDVVIVGLVMLGIFAFAGLKGVGFYVAQSAVAIIVLELFNYIAHYGMERRLRTDGRLEPLSHRHSWNSSSGLANLLIFNMGRHSDHHHRPAAHYQNLVPVDASPELPFGYAGNILLAFVPPLWRRVMDPRVLTLREPH